MLNTTLFLNKMIKTWINTHWHKMNTLASAVKPHSGYTLKYKHPEHPHHLFHPPNQRFSV